MGTAPEGLALALKFVARREAAAKLNVSCPFCGEKEQIQLKDWTSSLTLLFFKCRTCKMPNEVEDKFFPTHVTMRTTYNV